MRSLKSGYYILQTDGGMVSSGRRVSGEEPGEAAIGAVLRNPSLTALDAVSKPIGRATNHVAEYKAFIEGLGLALERGVTRIRVYVDSELVANQLTDRSRVKNPDLKKLHDQARQLLGRFADYRISWIPREWNSDADALVVAALRTPP